MSEQGFDRERDRIHRQMLSSVSHDLKTPLASIIGSLEVFTRMKDKLTAEKQETLISVALQEAYRLDAFITNILDMAKLENGMVNPKPENFEVAQLIRDCLNRMHRDLRGNPVDVQAASGVLKVMTDVVLLSRAVCQVLDNAVKYGGGPAAITFGRNDGQSAYISIRDRGPGIPSERLEDIFRKYTRFAREDQQNAGTGLGLAIARETMRLLNGQISATNHADGGAIFTLRFPVDRGANP